MTGRNNHPKRDGQQATPSRLDQHGETMANDNDFQDFTEEQQAAITSAACEQKD
ncbi:hypothetical protein [Paenibacillus sp.]|uniref:hypothetical protein n=1 Tax=Paenibacillus sp. TaxID=58172 RepID=UPI002D70092D|nr:hypothetical protein [Paenibacillus sp.]HZG56119.1 hypothetical protein [Paenibacillus sp.]